MVALVHMTAVDTVHCVGCTQRYTVAIGQTAGLNSEIRSMYSGLKGLLLYMAVADTSPLAGRGTLVGSAAGIADIAMTVAIGVGLTIVLRRGWVDQRCPAAERSQVVRKVLFHSPLVVLEVGRHEAVEDTL